MAVRIYALAKELKLDSKELVDICTNAGLPGKGSALASLTDEEAERVRQFVRGASGKPKSSAAAAPTPQRPAEPAAEEATNGAAASLEESDTEPKTQTSSDAE